MAQQSPTSVDVQDIQFKLHAKFGLFSEGNELKSLVSLLAVSSAKGLLFAGNQNDKELKVVKLKDVVGAQNAGHGLYTRVVSLPGVPKALACSCDGSMLAINYVLNNTGFLQIYQVDSFVTPNINTIYNIPVSPESYVFALQLLWNPVIHNNIALILNDGSVAMFNVNPGGQYDKVTLNKEHQVKSGCWSPKGKQIVFGFAEGKLQQFKPNLQPARAIPCPTGIYPHSFDCIAVHWLSTFQFAAVFLQKGQDMCPTLFIINAPKVGNPTYVSYYDICYSGAGPRIQQLTFNHIPQWNLLLVSSANGVEVGILGTKESGDNPLWIQYTLLDEARIEMPLTESKDETYPIGFAFDTASSHQVRRGELLLPVMPMVHVLSTHGHLVSFNFLNLSPNAADICSPPPPINDVSGQFRPLQESLKPVTGNQMQQRPPENEQPDMAKTAAMHEATFTLGSNVITSTPAIKDKPVPLFGSLTSGVPKPVATGFGFGGSAAATTNMPTQTGTIAPVGFGAQNIAPTFGGFASAQNFSAVKTIDKPPAPIYSSAAGSVSNVSKNIEANKPLYTVPPTFKPPPVVQPTKSAPSVKAVMNTGEIDEVVKQMIAIQIDAFEVEMRHIHLQARKLIENIGTPDEIKSYTKHLNDLQEIIEQADDHEFEHDVQSLRHSMSESYAMLAECRTKLDMYNNPNLTRLSAISSSDPTSRRQLGKLHAFVATNQTQLNQVNNLIDAQWSQYQDIVRRNTKNQMHIPCLDGVYQRMSKLKDLLSRQRNKMNHLKSKLKQKGLNYKPSNEADLTLVAVGALTKNQSTMESLADSILSMSLCQVVSQTHAKLSENKLNAIRNFTKQQHQITIIKPKRPDRVGLKSEVILETKLERDRKQKENVKQQQQKQQQQSRPQPQIQSISTIPLQKPIPQTQTKVSQQLPHLNMQHAQQQQTLLAKPTASKPPLLSNVNQQQTFITPSPAASTALTFGSQSSFVKTSVASTKHDEASRPLAASTPFPAFGTSSSIGFGQPKPNTGNVNLENKEHIPAVTPISFSAKVIGGNDVKPFANTANKTGNTGPDTTATNQGFAAFTGNKSTTLSGNIPKDEKKSDDMSKSFSFAGNPSINPSSSIISSTNAPAFGGFGALSKPGTTATTPSMATSSSGAVFSTSMFGASLPSSTATSFATLSSATSSTPVASPAAFSFITAASSESTTPSVVTKPTEAISLPTKVISSKAVDATTTAENVISTAPSNPASFSFGGISAANVTSAAPNASIKSSAPPNVTVTSSGIPDGKTGATPKAFVATSASNDPTDSIFGTLNICKPDVKETGDASKPSSNIFSGFGAASSNVTSSPFSFATSTAGDNVSTADLGSTTATSTQATSTSAGFSFGSTAAAPISTTAIATSSTTSSTTAVAASDPSSAPASKSFSFGTSTTSSSAPGSAFGSLTLSSTTAAVPDTTAATTTSTASSSVFGAASTGSSIFAQVTATTTGTTSIFGGAAAAASSGPSLFGSTAPIASAAATPNSGSIFGGSATTPAQPAAANIFGNIPKPDQSVFGSSSNTTAPPATGLFAAAAATSQPPAVAGGSIFGGTATGGFGAPDSGGGTAGGSIFGNSSTAAVTGTSPFGSATSPSSIFGGVAKPTEGGNIFGSPTQQSVSSGGSIFGKSTFGQTAAAPQSAGSIFGGAATQSPTGGGFGAPAGGSIFGGANAANTSSSASIFGGAAAANNPAFGTNAASPGFGSFSQSSNAPAFGAAGGGGGGFGSPQAQSAFAKPVFGGPATFGSPPAFGAQPTFGGAPTFGSPKSGFGTFAATSPTPGVGFGTAAPAPNQQSDGNIFETLGAANNGLSFGNLAQSTQPPQPKSSFGGSSFMNYR